MKQLKKIIRVIFLVLLIALAAILPFPIPVVHRDKSPKYITEQLDKEDEKDEEDQRT